MNDALDDGMFWVGALFAFTPIIVGGAAVGVWWLWRRRERTSGAPAAPPSPSAPVER
jgi:hypothetical protein